MSMARQRSSPTMTCSAPARAKSPRDHTVRARSVILVFRSGGVLAVMMSSAIYYSADRYPLLRRVGGAALPANRREAPDMVVTAFQDYPLADRDREWDGAEAEKRVRRWAGAEDEPNEKYRDAHVWYDSGSKDNFTGYKLLIADVIGGKIKAVPRGVMAAGQIMQGARGGANLPDNDIDRVKSHLAKYYAKMGEEAPWERG